MKICVGLKDSSRINEYINAGAKEFYCGVIEQRWINKFGYAIGINRRPWSSSNMSTFKELKQVVEIAHSNGCNVYFTMNEHCYNNEQISLLEYYVECALDVGVDAIIIADPGLIKHLYEKFNCCIHLSTGGTVFNRWSAEFFRDKLKVSRIIMPREVTLNEIKNISSEITNVEYEAFILNEGCINIDGFCNHLHGIKYVDQNGPLKNGDYSVGCMLKYELLDGKIKGEKLEPTHHNITEKLYHAASQCGTCGACAIYYLKQYGVSSLKLVGRATDRDKIISDIKFIKYAIDLSEEVDSFQEFCKRVRVYKSYNTIEECQKMCYYPDILK